MNRAFSSAAALAVASTLLLVGCSKETKSEGAPASSASPASPPATEPGAKDGNHPLFHPEKATETAPLRKLYQSAGPVAVASALLNLDAALTR